VIDLKRLVQATESLTLAGSPAGFQPWLMADIARAAEGRAVFVAPDEGAARAVIDAASYFAPELETIFVPAWDTLPYDRASPSLRVSSDRIAALAALAARPRGAQLVVTTVNALTQRTLRPERIAGLTARIGPGERIDRDQLAAKLQANGYVRTDTVAEAGEFAIRGGLLDLFPAGEELALRLDFFGDEIETVRRFDPGSQRTVDTSPGFTLMPVSEVLLTDEAIRAFRQGYVETFGATATGDPLYQAISDGRRLAGMENWLPLFEPELATLFDYLGNDDVIVRDSGAEKAAEQRFEAIADYHENRKAALTTSKGSYRPLPPDALYLSPDEWRERLTAGRAHLTSPFHVPEDTPRAVDLGAEPARDFAPERAANKNVYEAVERHVDGLRKAKTRVVLASYTGGARERLAGLLEEHGLKRLALVDSWQEALGAGAEGKVALVVVPLEHGFTFDDIAVLTEQDMLGDRLVRRKRAKKADAFLAELAMLTPGDLVVHADHGIGRYEGLTTIPVGNAPHDCVMLTYEGGDKLYVPVENIDALSRYGSESDGVALDRLGGAQWQARKARMKERIREIAGEILKTAAARATRPAPAAEPHPVGFAAFVDRFPYAETDDQLKAIDDVLADLASGHPMDRLVVGDVGFGKTEVALRAAFVAAMNGMQVAIVCPTTLLARQHYQNFRERFAGFPVEVRQLSRLVASGEAKKVREGLADGSVDVVIGTHAILAKNVEFRRLGLVVVDEEQRFGVTHKERLKALRTDVHVLTLTATPIPRTLQMAMSGLRELSVITTPPVDRLAVRTYVMPWDEVVVREALLREHYRGGQSFFVTPRIADLPDIEQFLRESVPEVRYVIAHGQMAPTEVEERMSAFYDKRYEVLVSTTIIESGLDIPSANTMIVHRADMFGLAQLYQIRGRVGRSKARAYAYLTTPVDLSITDTAEKRLQVLSGLDSLGAGFQLASHDLDIRGAGNLLGDEQSGHIREIGFELYQQMLEDAILAARAESQGLKPPEETFSPSIAVDAPILIPEDYVPDLNLRMALYRRMNELEDRPAIDGFAAELIDRFGKLPAEVKNLITVIETKLNCRIACIAKIEAGPKGAIVTFQGDRFPNPSGLIDYIQRLKGTAKLRPDQKLVVTRDWGGPEARLNGVLQLSRGLAKVANGEAVKAPAAPAAKPAPEPKKQVIGQYRSRGR
jgi:transcription-repair coupling factor (superfamily II helicase)